MAKSKTKNNSVKSKAKSNATKVSKRIEATTDMAHKIWLAGVGAYGKAYDNARDSANNVNAQSTELFEELVKRGEEIEGDVRTRLKSDERVTKATEQVQKAMDTARDIQGQARSQFDVRMERMRDVLGVKGLGSISDRISKQLDKLEDEVSEAAAKVAKKATKAKAAKKTVVKVPAKNVVADDLTLITGVGPAMMKRLAVNGITQFGQIAAMKKAEAVALDDKINARGRVIRDAWVKQAKSLAK